MQLHYFMDCVVSGRISFTITIFQPSSDKQRTEVKHRNAPHLLLGLIVFVKDSRINIVIQIISVRLFLAVCQKAFQYIFAAVRLRDLYITTTKEIMINFLICSVRIYVQMSRDSPPCLL